MRTLERGVQKESFERMVFSVAQAYGFTSQPVTVSRKDLGMVPDSVDKDSAIMLALSSSLGAVSSTTQVWAAAKKGGGTAIVFAAASPKVSVAQAFVVKAALGTAESAGIVKPRVLISSVGDAESRKRHLRELGNFFKKYARDLPEAVAERSHKDPDGAAAETVRMEHELAELLPRTIDCLSEPSRRIMLETIALFEKLGIAYELEPRLPYTPDVNRELVFAIEGEDKRGNTVRIAQGGRFDPDVKKGAPPQEFVGISVSVPEQIDARRAKDAPLPACFVIHVGEAAKLKAFMLLDSLWRAHISLGQALLAETIAEQMQRAQESQAQYIAIVGQREALDGTVIMKNAATELQETVPIEKLIAKLGRVRV